MKRTATCLLVAAAVAVTGVTAQVVENTENPCLKEIAVVCDKDANQVTTPKELHMVKQCMMKAVEDRTMCVNDWCSPCHEYMIASVDDAKVLRACADDAKVGRCKKYSDGQTVVNCLNMVRNHGRDELSPPCMAELESQDWLGNLTTKVIDAAKAMWAHMNKGRNACKADRERLCPDMTNKIELRDCMKNLSQEEPSQLSEDCVTYLAGRRFKPGHGGRRTGGSKLLR